MVAALPASDGSSAGLDHTEDVTITPAAAARTALDAFTQKVKSWPAAFTEAPTGLPARNTPGELVARAESAYFLACGAAEDCQRRIGP